MLSYPIHDATKLFLLLPVRQVAVRFCKRTTITCESAHIFSQTFLQTQRRYSTFDLELLAILLQIRHYRYFVDGRQFTVYTDHAPLCHVIFTYSRHSSPLQHSRHLNFISQFTSDVQFIKEKDNLVLHCLSRTVGAVFGKQPTT